MLVVADQPAMRVVTMFLPVPTARKKAPRLPADRCSPNSASASPPRRQQVIQYRENGLLHLAGVAGPAITAMRRVKSMAMQVSEFVPSSSGSV